MQHLSTYSSRAKIGLIVPPTNTVNEAEWRAMAPDQVTFHTTRMRLHADTTSDAGRAKLWADLGAAIDLIAPARVDVIAYACTAGSMLSPPESVTERMSALAGRPCMSTALAIVLALRHLKAKRIAIATPYHDALNTHETHFLADCGIETLKIVGLGIGANGPQEYIRIAETPLDAVRRHAAGVMVPGADALLISCTDFPTLPLIAGLEAQLGVPVISSNTATLWAALRVAGVNDAIPSAGRLFE